MQALAQDLAQSGIALRWEIVRRPDTLRYPALGDGFAVKLISSYDWLEANADFDAPVHISYISLATALDWLAFRDLPSFRDGRGRCADCNITVANYGANLLISPSVFRDAMVRLPRPRQHRCQQPTESRR